MKALPLPLYQVWAQYILVRILLPNFRYLQAENPEWILLFTVDVSFIMKSIPSGHVCLSFDW